MMPFALNMPKLSPTMESGTIVKWHKKIGDFIQAGDVLIEVATDKATIEYSAIDEGWLRKILVPEGSEVLVQRPIAVFTLNPTDSIEGFPPEEKPLKEAEEKISASSSEQSQSSQRTEKKTQDADHLAQPRFVPLPPLENYEFPFLRESGPGRVIATPLAKKIAKEKGLDLASLKGSGPHGRISTRDLDNARQIEKYGSFEQDVPSIPPGTYEELALTPIRKIIAQRLQESKSFIPHFYVSQDVDASFLMDIRKQLNNQGIKFSVNDFILRAVALSLREHPILNSGFNSDTQRMISFKTIDIAMAVSTEAGLVTPIIRHADYKRLSDLSRESKYLSQKAREGKLEMHEYKGGSFTISNLGMYGVTNFQAIINPPQAAILAVGGIIQTPVVKEGLVVPGQLMQLTLSVDHRVVDGVQAARFLLTVKRILESPALLLV